MRKKLFITALSMMLGLLALSVLNRPSWQPVLAQGGTPETPVSSFPGNEDDVAEITDQVSQMQSLAGFTQTQSSSPDFDQIQTEKMIVVPDSDAKNRSLPAIDANIDVAPDFATGLSDAVPLLPTDGQSRTLASSKAAAICTEYLGNNSFEFNHSWKWYRWPNANYSYSFALDGFRSGTLNSRLMAEPNAFMWQSPFISGSNDEIAVLQFYSGFTFGDPGEVAYVEIYDGTIPIISRAIIYPEPGYWYFYRIEFPAALISGRQIDVGVRLAQDYDPFYSEVFFDLFELWTCDEVDPEPTPTPVPVRDLAIDQIKVTQAFLTEQDPVTNIPIPLIDGRASLIRVHLDITGDSARQVANVKVRLSITDQFGTTRQIVSSPKTINRNADPNDLRNIFNFSPPISWLRGDVVIRAEVDPDGDIPETDENNNLASVNRSFQAGQKLRIGWVPMPYWRGSAIQFPDLQTAYQGATKLSRIYPGGIYDLEYYFQPGFREIMPVPLNGQTATFYLNTLKRFFNFLNYFNAWPGGKPADRLYGWTSGRDAQGLCGIASSLSGPVATGIDASAISAGCGGPETFAHEIGHTLGLRHTLNNPPTVDPRCMGVPAGPNPNHPNYPGGPLGSIGAIGLDLQLGQLMSPLDTYDFMTYCHDTWISPYNYTKLATGALPLANRQQIPLAEPASYLMVSGRIQTPSLSVDFDPFYVITSTTSTDQNDTSDFCIELQDNTSTILDNQCFDLAFYDHENEVPLDEDYFALVAPYPPGTTEIVLSHKGTPIHSRTVSPNAPVVTLMAPNGGENLAGTETYTVTWTGNDPDGDTLYYSLAYSADNGTTWIPLGFDITDTSKAIDLSNLPGGDTVRFRISVSDGVNTSYDSSDATLSVGRKPPTVVILSEDVSVPEGEAVVLQGAGYDLEDGILADSALQWHSDLDGDLNAGQSLIMVLSMGVHQITLTATDSDAQTASAMITVKVGNTNSVYLPLIYNDQGDEDNGGNEPGTSTP